MKKIIFLILSATAVILFVPIAKAQATTFPVDQAGIAAYTKLDSFDPVYFDRAKSGFLNSVEAVGETYLIGTKKYPASDNDADNLVSVNVYASTDGWLVAYISANDEYSKIVNWKTGAALDNTLLKVAIDEAIQKFGATSSTPVKYYDFANPDANKMALIKETISPNNQITSNDYTIFVPGTTYVFSFALHCNDCVGQPQSIIADFLIEGKYSQNFGEINRWSYFDPAAFNINPASRLLILRTIGSGTNSVSAVSLVVAKVN